MSNTCPFCLAQEGTIDIFHGNYCEGKREVFTDIFFNTFNVKIPKNIYNSKTCENCTSELQKAAEFKMKVLKSINSLTVKNLKMENDESDDLYDKISVEFDDGPQPGNDTDKVYVIKLNSSKSEKTIPNKKKKTFVRKGFCAEDLNVRGEDVASSFDQDTSILQEGQEKNHRGDRKKKSKLTESQNHKDLKENSLKLVFNSNLCLFKSLKTKFGCFTCKEAFLNIKELREHSKIHSNNELVRAKFHRLRGLSYQNADISNLECSKCREACIDLTELKKHLIEKHGDEFGNAEHFLIPYKLEDSFDCVLCNEKFNTYMSLSVHMNKHYSNYVCEICGNSYINKISLRIHLQTRHKEKKCSLCSEVFLTSYARVRHMRKNHNRSMSKRYCLTCGKTFLYTYQLMEHKIQEHGAKRQLNKCALCPKTFPNPQNLKIHIRCVHVKERNFPCGTCDMRFFTKNDQKRHEKSHLDVKMFTCEFCETKFKFKDSLRRHQKRQHGKC